MVTKGEVRIILVAPTANLKVKFIHAFPGTYLLPKRYCDRGMSVR